MNADFFVDLEKAPYPTGMIPTEGEHLRQLTTNQSTYTPSIKPIAPLSRLLPICIPTNRHILKNRKNIRRLMQLATERDNSFLIFLCSGPASKDDVAILAKDFPGLQWLAIDGPFLSTQNSLSLKTTYPLLYTHGTRDLAEKRNFVLRMAYAMHWKEIFLLDDDIIITRAQIEKAHALLQQKDVSIVGFSARDFPDLSVAMHAHRWIHDSPDSFIGGGALAIKIKTSFVSFFPHVYNDDWLFLLAYHLTGGGKIVWAGTIRQRAFNPFRNTERAVSEEVGDIIAEGLYKLVLALQSSGVHFGHAGELTTKFCKYANEDFWNIEINNRLDYLQTVREDIRRKKLHPIRRIQAIRALDQAIRYILDPGEGISGKELAAWTRAWCKDVEAWDKLPKPKTPYKTIADAFKALSLVNTFTGNTDATFETVSAAQTHPPGNDLYQGYTMRTRTHIQKKGLWLTQITQQYLVDKNMKMEKLATSANALRFDRPATGIPAIKPGFTICVIIQYGESIALMRKSVASILKWVQSKGPSQIVIWVYDNDGRHTRQQLEVYRNRATAQLVYDLASTEVQLRSGVIDASKKQMSQIIGHMLSDVTFAYWKIGINPEHPIFVINSQGELLPLGTLGQFIHQEQQLSYQSLQQVLQMLPSAVTQEINDKYDKEALLMARQRLAQRIPYYRQSSLTTKQMIRRMKAAKLTWLEQDDLAYSFVFHSIDGRNSIDTIKRVVCIPVICSDMSTNQQMIASEIIKKITSANNTDTCLVAVYSYSHIPWKTLDTYCKDLMKKVAQQSSEDIAFISITYRLSPGETTTMFKRRMLSTIEYSHWLQNHNEPIVIKWCP